MVTLSYKTIVPTLAAIGVTMLALNLGQWQTHRAQEKLKLKATLEQAAALAPLKIDQVTPADFEKRIGYEEEEVGLKQNERTTRNFECERRCYSSFW